jgi:hypothetical protein
MPGETCAASTMAWVISLLIAIAFLAGIGAVKAVPVCGVRRNRHHFIIRQF